MLGDRQITANFVKYRLTISLTLTKTEIRNQVSANRLGIESYSSIYVFLLILYHTEDTCVRKRLALPLGKVKNDNDL